MHRILHTTRIGEDIALERRLVNRTCRIGVFPILRSIRVLNGRFWPLPAIRHNQSRGTGAALSGYSPGVIFSGAT